MGVTAQNITQDILGNALQAAEIDMVVMKLNDQRVVDCDESYNTKSPIHTQMQKCALFTFCGGFGTDGNGWR